MASFVGTGRRTNQAKIEDIKEKKVQKLVEEAQGSTTTAATTTTANPRTELAEKKLMERMFKLPSFQKIPKELRERMLEEMKDEMNSESSGYQSLTGSTL